MSNELKTIVIDAGHGGHGKVGGSSGNNAVGANGLVEKDLTLDIARRTATVLKDSANVVLTRNADVNLSLIERADIARHNRASVFLSLHFNGFSDTSVDGTEVFIGSKAGTASERLAGDLLENLAHVTRAQKRGVKRADLGVLATGRQLPETSACLVEIAFLSNPAQAKDLEDRAYRQQIALALGDAVLKNLRGAHASQQGVSFEYEDDDLGEQHFQSLDAGAMSGNPVFDISGTVSKTSTNGDDTFAVKKRLIQLGYDWITLDKKMDTTTVDAIKLFQTIIAGNNAISGDGKIDVGKNTHKWLQAINAPRWQTMPAGSQAEGFLNFELSDTKDTHDFGTHWIADTIKAAAAHYRDNYLKTHSSAALLTVNDVSLPHGGNTPDHDGHEAGLACDLQLPKTDGKAGGINLTIPAQKALYDRDAARAILNALRAQPNMSSIFLNDDVLIGEGLCARLKGHDHHIHFQINPPARGAIETDGMGYYHSGGRLYQGSHQDDIDYAHSLDACGNLKGIPKSQIFAEFKDMKTESDLPNTAQNVCLRWNEIPANTCEVDVVVHFHGYNITQETAFFKYVEDISGLKLSKRVRPTLGILPFGKSFKTKDPKRVGYNFPFVEKNSDGLRQLIKFGLDELAKRGGLPPGTLRMGRLILTAHSGGGSTLSKILDLDKYPVDEVQLFDAIYGCDWDDQCKCYKNEDCQYGPVVRWAKKKIAADAQGGALRVVYVSTPLSKKIETAFKGLTPALAKFYKVEYSDLDHNDIPKIFGPILLGDAGATLDLLKSKATTKSIGLDYDEPDYFAEREASYTNY